MSGTPLYLPLSLYDVSRVSSKASFNMSLVRGAILGENEFP